MANPLKVACPAGVWTKVATAVTSGVILKQNNRPSSYIQTYRLTGEAAPANEDDAGPIFERSDYAEIGHNAAIDVYIKAKGAAGAVRVDL